MKHAKHWHFLVPIIVLCLLLTACSPKASDMEAAPDVLSVYASFYPLYALADMLVQDVSGVELHCLVQPQDGCLRSYSLSDWDLALLSGSADAILTGGCGLESFESLLYALGESGPAVFALLYGMELENMRAVNTSDDADSHWLQDNPHIYMDIDGALEITDRIAAAMTTLDPDNEAAYADNLENARAKLSDLKTELQADLSILKDRSVVVMNEALVYAAETYGLDIELCYERESGEDLAGADLQNCLNQLAQSDARVILLEKQASSRLCRALKEAGYQLALLDTLSTRRADEGSDGFFRAHRSNVQAILNAFAEAN